MSRITPNVMAAAWFVFACIMLVDTVFDAIPVVVVLSCYLSILVLSIYAHARGVGDD